MSFNNLDRTAWFFPHYKWLLTYSHILYWRLRHLGVSKKTKKPIKPRKLKKKITEKTESWKKPIKILKKSTGLVRFWFYKLETEKTKPNPNRKKPSQTEKPSQNRKNRAKPEKTEPKPSQTGLNRFLSKKPNRNRSVWTGFSSVSIFLKKFQFN